MLLGLTIVSSQEQFDIHKFCFANFILFASVYMCLTIYLFSNCGFDVRSSPLGYIGIKTERRSFQYKQLILKVNLVIIPLMLIFYWYHNASCRPYVYTLFCITEYLVVLLNMGFHMCAYLDFYGLSVEVPSVDNIFMSKHNLQDGRRNEHEHLIDKEGV